MRIIFKALLTVALLSLPAFATIINVPGDQPTIQAGIDAAFDGDIVLVANGTYTGTGNKNIDFTGKAIVVMSEDGPENCIIDCENNGRAFYFHNNEDTASVLYGIQITNGRVTETGGGGILIENSSPLIKCGIFHENSATGFLIDGAGIGCINSNAVITNCIFTDNSVDTDGGGINCKDSSSITVSYCTFIGNVSVNYSGAGIRTTDSDLSVFQCNFKDNYCDWGSAIYSDVSNVEIKYCTFESNIANNYGGAVENGTDSYMSLIHCVFNGNSASRGGAIYCASSSITNFTNTIVTGSSSGSGIYIGNSLNTTVSYCDFFNNISGNFSGSVPANLGIINSTNANGDPCDIFFNIYEDPLFVSGPGGDYYLSQSSSGQTPQSPCVDAGDPSSPLFEGWTRTDEIQDDGIVDIGYHYGPPVECPFCPFKSTITGSVIPQFAGLTIDLFDDVNMLMLVSSTLTASDGTYLFPDLEPGDYIVELIEPLGFSIDQNNVPVSLAGGDTAVVNFELSQSVVANDARSKGYWKHQVNANISGNGNIDYTTEELLEFSLDIFDHFAGNSGSPVMVEDVSYVYNPPVALGMDDMQYMLNINQGGSTMYDRACQQFLTLLLNVVSDKLGQYFQASEDSATVSQAIVYIDEILETESELAKDIAETLNQGQMVAAGVIPLTTPNIIFGVEIEGILQPLTFEFKNPAPNPFNPETRISFSLPEASEVSLVVYDVQGREVATLVNGWQPAGMHEVTFNASDLTSGVYFARLTAGEFQGIKKLLLLK